MKSIGGNAKAITEYLKASKGTKEEAAAAAAKIGELANEIPEAFKVEASLSEMDAVGKNRGKPEIWLDWEGFVEHAEMLGRKGAAWAAALETAEGTGIKPASADRDKNGGGS